MRVKPDAFQDAWIISIVLVMIWWLTACSSAGMKTIEPGKDALSIEVRDNGFYPSRWRVNSGSIVKVTITNNASFDADWVVMGRPPELPFDSSDQADIWFRKEIAKEETVTFSFQVPAMPGEYIVVCSYPGRWEQGLMGKLIVVDPE